jgi:hypothetical protein
MEFGIHHEFLHADIYRTRNNSIPHEQSDKAFKSYKSEVKASIASKDKVFLRS